MSSPLLIINAVSAKAGGGVTDLVHTLPLLERKLYSLGWRVKTYVVRAGGEALRHAGVSREAVEVVDASSPLARATWELHRLPKIVRHEKPDVVFQFSNLIFRALAAPQVVVLRSQTFFSGDYAAQSRRGLYHRLRFAIGKQRSRKTIETASEVFCISQTQKDDICRSLGASGERVQVAHLGVSLPARIHRGERLDALGGLETLSPEQHVIISRALRPGCRVLVNISHYYQQKNLLTLLEAVDAMSHVDPKIRLVLTAGVTSYDGPAGERERREIAIARDLERRGILADLGPVRKECVWPLLQLADVFVFPSSLESFGHPLLEAMAVGTPVVASDTPIHREIAGNAAAFHHTFDSKALAAAVCDVLQDSALRSTLVAAGEQVVARFSWESHVQKLVDGILRAASQPAETRELVAGRAS